ncbi:MAG: hypothetical protein AAGC68_04520 [Verrucomicrobiota bacterium]
MTEITLSIGIVATILLPIIALLASGSRMTADSDDQDAAVRISRGLVRQIRPVSGENRFEVTVDPKGDPITILPPAGEDSASAYLAYDQSGRFVMPLSETEYANGLPAESGALYAVRIALTKAPSTGPIALDLYRLDILVESPLAAASRVRDRTRLQTRLSAP